MIDKTLEKHFTSTEIVVSDTIQIRKWQDLIKGSQINHSDAQHMAVVFNSKEEPQFVIGYLKKGKTEEFVRQKTLTDTGTWNTQIKTSVNADEIYQVIAVQTCYKSQNDSVDGTQIEITFEGFKSPGFKTPNKQIDENAEPSSTQNTGSDNVTAKTGSVNTGTDSEMFDLRPADESPTQDSQQCEVEPSIEEDVQTDILHLFAEIDFNYWNEEKWPGNMFSFQRNDSGKVSYSGNTRTNYFTKLSRTDINERLQHDKESFHGQKKRGFVMENGYDYFLCALAPELSAKVYEESFMQQNESYLGRNLEKEQGITDDEFKARLKSKVRKYYGFLEVFKMKKGGLQNGSLYEQTGKIIKLT